MQVPDDLNEELTRAFQDVRKPSEVVKYRDTWESPRYEKFLLDWDPIDLGKEEMNDPKAQDVWIWATPETVRYFLPALCRLVLQYPHKINWCFYGLDEALYALLNAAQLRALYNVCDYMAWADDRNVQLALSRRLEDLIAEIQEQLDRVEREGTSPSQFPRD